MIKLPSDNPVLSCLATTIRHRGMVNPRGAGNYHMTLGEVSHLPMFPSPSAYPPEDVPPEQLPAPLAAGIRAAMWSLVISKMEAYRKVMMLSS